MSFNRKRDRIQIIAAVLSSCRRPQTQTYIRRQTNISYDLLQSCIMELLLRHWIIQKQDGFGQKKLAITEKGLTFLEKWVELQMLVETKNLHRLRVHAPEIQMLTVKST